MTQPQPITLTLDRRLLEHPRAHHLRRMRVGIWLYLDLLARLPTGAVTLEVEPAVVGREMGLPEGTIRSWLGHLRTSGYLDAKRLNGAVRVTVKGAMRDEPGSAPASTRFFTAKKLADALGDRRAGDALEAALGLYPDAVIKRALAGTLAVPENRIRSSRLALFLYLLKRHAKET